MLKNMYGSPMIHELKTACQLKDIFNRESRTRYLNELPENSISSLSSAR